MSYITSSFSPYKSKNLNKEFFEILQEDYKWICSSLETRGFIFFVAVITLMSMSLLKAIIFVLEQLPKPTATYNHLKLQRGMNEESITSILSRREAIDEIQNRDNLCPNSKEKTQRVQAISELRNYLYQHDLTLYGTVIKTINHRLTDEELSEMYRTGELTKPLSTTYITFGETVNNLLREVIGSSISLRKDKFSGETSIKIVNDEIFTLQDKLKNMYNETITIKLD